MTTEYRRSIPSRAHIEAATRLGLLWHRRGRDDAYVRFAVVGGRVLSRISPVLGLMEEPVVCVWPYEGDFSYRPIRPDGTPVDWEVLDQEVARVGQQGQPQGFRADLWRRICGLFHSHTESANFRLDTVDRIEGRWLTFRNGATLSGITPDILARWTV